MKTQLAKGTIPVAAVLMLLVYANCALAESQLPPHEAPIGHRQPTAASVPQEEPDTSFDKTLKELDEALDKKLHGICRGC